MESQRAGAVLPQRRQDDGGGRYDAAGLSLRASPKVLFEGRYVPTPRTFPDYDVSPDGQRFLMLKPTEQGRGADANQRGAELV